MIQKREGNAREAARRGAQIMRSQEIFVGPYFCQEKNVK